MDCVPRRWTLSSSSVAIIDVSKAGDVGGDLFCVQEASGRGERRR